MYSVLSLQVNSVRDVVVLGIKFGVKGNRDVAWRLSIDAADLQVVRVQLLIGVTPRKDIEVELVGAGCSFCRKQVSVVKLQFVADSFAWVERILQFVHCAIEEFLDYKLVLFCR